MHTILGPRFQNRKLPWQNLESPLPHEGIRGVQAALRYAGLDYPVFRAPIQAGAESPTTIPNRFALCRWVDNPTSDRQILGIVGPDYTIIQNMHLAQALDRSGLTESYPVVSVGQIWHGQQIFICLKMGEAQVADESYCHYLLIMTGHDGKTATTIAITPVRIACTNALLRGVKSATSVLKINHNNTIMSLNRVSQEMDLHTQVTDLTQGMTEKLTTMAQSRITFDEERAILHRIFPEAPAPAPVHLVPGIAESIHQMQLAYAEKQERAYQNHMRRRDTLINTTRDLHNTFNMAHPELARTRYSLYQAVTELALHREGPTSKQGEDSVAVSALVGTRAAQMGRAWNLIQGTTDDGA